MSDVLVTGGSGLLGREVVARLAAAGHAVRILSRSGSADPRAVPGDLGTGAGLDAAVAGVAAVVHCASDFGDPQRIDVEGTRRLVEAARRAGRAHVVDVSIVGVDRIPWAYYRAKALAEQVVTSSGLPWTVLRATQFHEFAAAQLARLTRLPVVPAPRGWRFQPIEVGEVAARLAAAVDDGPAGRLPDVGGPEVLSIADLARRHLAATGRRRPVVTLPVPGAFSAALRSGANLAPDNRAGGRTFAQFLALPSNTDRPSGTSRPSPTGGSTTGATS
jgi:uncharacterized protein YbjT (DUF2867 family)